MSEQVKLGRILRKSAPAMILLAALAAVVLIALVLKKRSEDKPVGGRPAVNVRTVVVSPESQVLDTFEIVGKVEADRVVEVSAEVAGRVEQVLGQEGRDIRAGEPIIRLNTDILQAEFDRDMAQYQFDAREYEHIADLHKKGAATANEADQARTKVAISKAAFDIAKARLDRSVIVAPIDGTLNKIIPEVGAYVNPGEVVAVIVDMDPAKVVVDVSERDVPFLEIGREEQVILSGQFGKTLTGKVAYVSKLIDPAANTTRVEINVDNRDGVLWGGQIVNVRLLRRELTNVILVPLEVVIPMEEGDKVVYIVEDGKAERREVELDPGFLKGGRVLVRKGLKTGERLIVDGLRFVSPGVEVKEQESSGPAISQPMSQPSDANEEGETEDGK